MATICDAISRFDQLALLSCHNHSSAHSFITEKKIKIILILASLLFSLASVQRSELAVKFSDEIFESSTASFREITKLITSIRESHHGNSFRNQTFV
jgi:hypothetical protein